MTNLTPLTKCARTGCEQSATHWPVIQAWALGHKKNSHPPLEMHIGIPHCASCANAAAPNDLVSDDSWRAIVGAVVAQGKAIPDRDSLAIRWELRT